MWRSPHSREEGRLHREDKEIGGDSKARGSPRGVLARKALFSVLKPAAITGVRAPLTGLPALRFLLLNFTGSR